MRFRLPRVGADGYVKTALILNLPSAQTRLRSKSCNKAWYSALMLSVSGGRPTNGCPLKDGLTAAG